MKRKILIYTDSRGQHTPRGVPVHDVFALRLAQRDDIETEVVLCPMKWTTTIDFFDYLRERRSESYDHIILFTGIVEWSPRPQTSAIQDLYNNQQPLNLGNMALNTREYTKKIVNCKKPSFDAVFGKSAMLGHLENDFGVEYEGQQTINMYGLEMARKDLLPRLAALDNLLFINSNRFIPGWEGDFTRGRPANIGVTEQYSALFRDLLGPQKVIDLLQWSDEEVKRLTCDNLHLTKAGSDRIYEEICYRLLLDRKPAMAGETANLASVPGTSPVSPFNRPIEPPHKLTSKERAACLAQAGLGPNDKLATLIIGCRLSNDPDDPRTGNLLFLLRWIDRFYGDLFDVLIVEQDEKSKIRQILRQFRPYVRHEFIYNPQPYNRGWGYNVAVRHFTRTPVVALMDTDVLTGGNFVREIVDCHSKYKVISPYTNVYFTDANEASAVETSFAYSGLADVAKVAKPTTITGGVLVIRRDLYEQVAGFEQYIDYGCEDRALDVTLLNKIDASEIRMAPATYVHLDHPIGKTDHSQLKQRLAHLKENFGCEVDRSISATDFIHKNCRHASAEKTERNSAARRGSYGDLDLYRSGKPLKINGCYMNANVSSAPEPLFPPEFSDLKAYESKELYKAPDPDVDRLAALYNKFKGERCFIIGNGPSLNRHDLSLLKDEHVFAVNSFFYKTDDSGFRPTFYVVEDNAVMKENVERIKAFEAPYKFFPTIYKNLHPEADNVYFFRMNRGFYEKSSPNYCVPRFSPDAAKVLYCGQSVTYINLQLAFFMGFTEVHLIGMDFDYVIPKEHERRGDLIVSTTDDPNHFHKDYFGKGKTWKDPKLDRVAMNYRQAKLSYEAVGRKIYNATVGGKLEIFDRVDYETLLRDPVTGKKRREQIAPVIVLSADDTRAAVAPTASDSQPSPPYIASGPQNPRAEFSASDRTKASDIGDSGKGRLWQTGGSVGGSPRRRGGIRLDYGHLALGVRSRAPTLFRLGQMVVWSLRVARRHKFAALLAAVVCAALVASPFLFAPAWPWRVGYWTAAGAIAAAAIAIAILREAFRRILDAQDASLSQAIRSVRQANERRANEIAKSLASLVAQKTMLARGVKMLRAEVTTGMAVKIEQASDAAKANDAALRDDFLALQQGIDQRLHPEILEQVESLEAASTAKLAEMTSATQTEMERLAGELAEAEAALQTNLESLKDSFEQKLDDARKVAETRDQRVSALGNELNEIRSRTVSLDVVSALRAMRPMWFGGSAVQTLTQQPEFEHGHAVLMAVMADEEHLRPGLLAGKTLIEIGTTRERDPHQGSTEKLAVFTAMTGMRFITVDMDPANTASAGKTLRYLNPSAQAVTGKGEDFLAMHAGALDFVYLDAFDFDHGKHSEERQSRYKQFLHTQISDPECWKMHEACARAIVAGMPEGGIVVLDDTWKDLDGNYAGKGKLAVPLLLDSGFEIVVATKMTVALRRTIASGAPTDAGQKQKQKPEKKKKKGGKTAR